MIVQVVNLSSADWVIISALSVTIVSLAGFIVWNFKSQKAERTERDNILQSTHEKHRISQDQNLINMIQAMTRNTTAIEGNTKIIDEVKSLMHTVNDRLIKMDAKNGNSH